jgi:hypothetical protein
MRLHSTRRWQDSQHTACAPEPLGIVTKGEIVEVCFRTTDNDPGYHMANLGWPCATRTGASSASRIL